MWLLTTCVCYIHFYPYASLKTLFLPCLVLLILPIFLCVCMRCFLAELSQMNGCLGRADFPSSFMEFKARRKHQMTQFDLCRKVSCCCMKPCSLHVMKAHTVTGIVFHLETLKEQGLPRLLPRCLFHYLTTLAL